MGFYSRKGRQKHCFKCTSSAENDVSVSIQSFPNTRLLLPRGDHIEQFVRILQFCTLKDGFAVVIPLSSILNHKKLNPSSLDDLIGKKLFIFDDIRSKKNIFFHFDIVTVSSLTDYVMNTEKAMVERLETKEEDVIEEDGEPFTVRLLSYDSHLGYTRAVPMNRSLPFVYVTMGTVESAAGFVEVRRTTTNINDMWLCKVVRDLARYDPVLLQAFGADESLTLSMLDEEEIIPEFMSEIEDDEENVLDLTEYSQKTFSIDTQNTRDIDDAFTFLSKGNDKTLCIHIVDMTANKQLIDEKEGLLQSVYGEEHCYKHMFGSKDGKQGLVANQNKRCLTLWLDKDDEGFNYDFHQTLVNVSENRCYSTCHDLESILESVSSFLQQFCDEYDVPIEFDESDPATVVMNMMLVYGAMFAQMCCEDGIKCMYRYNSYNQGTKPIKHEYLGFKYVRATSPLRRLSDLMMQCVLKAALKDESYAINSMVFGECIEQEVAANRVSRNAGLWRLDHLASLGYTKFSAQVKRLDMDNTNIGLCIDLPQEYVRQFVFMHRHSFYCGFSYFTDISVIDSLLESGAKSLNLSVKTGSSVFRLGIPSLSVTSKVDTVDDEINFGVQSFYSMNDLKSTNILPDPPLFEIPTMRNPFGIPVFLERSKIFYFVDQAMQGYTVPLLCSRGVFGSRINYIIAHCENNVGFCGLVDNGDQNSVFLITNELMSERLIINMERNCEHLYRLPEGRKLFNMDDYHRCFSQSSYSFLQKCI
ncbi:hypothetical protein PCE1_003456 [Barthelona sp. PCE]